MQTSLGILWSQLPKRKETKSWGVSSPYSFRSKSCILPRAETEDTTTPQIEQFQIKIREKGKGSKTCPPQEGEGEVR